VNVFVGGRQVAPKDRRLWVAAQIIGVGIFGAIGVGMVIAGTVHLV